MKVSESDPVRTAPLRLKKVVVCLDIPILRYRLLSIRVAWCLWYYLLGWPRQEQANFLPECPYWAVPWATAGALDRMRVDTLFLNTGFEGLCTFFRGSSLYAGLTYL